MNEFDRHLALMELDKEELVRMVENGVDHVWFLTERLLYISESVGMPRELIQNVLNMDDKTTEWAINKAHDFWRKNGTEIPSEQDHDNDHDGPDIVVLDLRQSHGD